MQSVPIGGHTLPPLPFAPSALEPYLSAETIRIHHDILHLGYVEGLNRAELELARARASGDFSLIKTWEREVAYHGSGHILHSIYWTNLSPGGGGLPRGRTAQLIVRDFGSFAAFQAQFSEATIKVEASGWGILVWETPWRRLGILTAEKHQNLTQWGVIPLLTIDAWEHAYYLDYQNLRGEYLAAIWNLINWEDVEMRLVMAQGGKMVGIP